MTDGTKALWQFWRTITITVTDETGNELIVTNNQFTMPAGDVTVSVTFEEGVEINYSFLMPSENITIQAIYVEQEIPVEKKGTAYIESVKKTDSNKLVFVSILSVPEQCKITAAGLVATNDDQIGADICAESVAITADKKVFVRYAAGTNRNLKYTWTKSNVSSDETWYVKAYLVYKDESDKTQTVYGELVTATLASVQ